MSDFLPFLVIGLVTGSVYGLCAVGLVLTYRTSGIFNFAQGSVATMSVFVFYYLRTQHHWPWGLAAAVAVFVIGPLLGLLLESMARILANASATLQIAATIGIVITVIALGNIWYGTLDASIPPYLPVSTIRILSVNISWGQIAIILVSLAATGGLYYFLRYVRLGAAMRAVVDDAALVSMTGESPVRIRRWAWIIGATFASLSGILLAPSLSLDGLILTLLVVQAFGAAAIGYFSSLPLTYLGGLILGILAAFATKYAVQYPSLSGLPAGLPFIILFLVLIFTPKALLSVRRYVPNIRLADPYYAPPRVRIVFGVLAVAFLALLPEIVGGKLSVYSAGLIDVILFVSLGLLVRLSGQVSLCQYAFAAVGGAAMAHFTHGLGLPWLVALLLAGLVAVPIGAIIAIPAIRLSGVFLALATLGFGILLEQMFYTQGFMFGPTGAGIPVPRPHFKIGGINLQTSKGFYYVILVFAVLAAIAMVMIMRSRLGRILGALSDSPLALETLGTTVNVARVLVFCISAFLASIAGALTVSLFNFALGSEFSSFSSLTLLALVAIIPVGAPWFALIAGAGLEVIPAYINVSQITNYMSILFGVSAAIAPITLAHYPGAPRSVRRFAEAMDRLLPHRAKPATTPQPIHYAVRGGGLAIEDLSIRYGGVLAVDGLSLAAPVGSITGLIGPNGAGKTSTFNAICGLVHPSSGQLLLHGEDISNASPATRARNGLGRTFQRVELFSSLTVRENVALGREAVLAGGSPVSQLMSRPGDSDLILSSVEEAINLTGIDDIVDRRVSEISTGQRRLVELARVLAGPFDMILLDEPSSGLGASETERFGQILADVVAVRGLGILLVEHDMSLVHQVCERVWVLDFGRLIFSGTAAEMVASDIVKAAYLGSEVGTAEPREHVEAPAPAIQVLRTLESPDKPTISQAPLLKLADVSAGYGASTVLWDVNLEVPRSSIVALLGPNGAGKSTLLRTACGIIPAKKGKVLLDGEDITGQQTHQRARLGVCLVPEGRGIFPSLTVRENLVFFSPKGTESAMIERAIEAFPTLGTRLRQTTGSLSGGEQQMLAIVRAYISDPRIVIVDEASMGLAPLVVERLFEFLTRVTREGTALLLVEQYIYRALEMANEVYILNHGRIVFSGSPAAAQQEDILERYLGAEAAVSDLTATVRD